MGGCIACIGCKGRHVVDHRHVPPQLKLFPVGEVMNKNITVRAGNCNPCKYLPRLFELVRSGVFRPEQFFTQKSPMGSVHRCVSPLRTARVWLAESEVGRDRFQKRHSRARWRREARLVAVGAKLEAYDSGFLFYCFRYTPTVLTILPIRSSEVVVMVMSLPSCETARRLVATNWSPRE